MKLLDLKTLDYGTWLTLEKKLGREVKGNELVSTVFLELINKVSPSELTQRPAYLGPLLLEGNTSDIG